MVQLERDMHASLAHDNQRELTSTLEECRKLYIENERLKQIIEGIKKAIETP